MKGGIRRFVAAAAKALRRGKGRLKSGGETVTMPDPVLLPPRPVNSNRNRYRGHGRKRLGTPPCQPGTITYHDKLVKHFGARVARKMYHASVEEFAANPPWAHLRSGTGSESTSEKKLLDERG